jgi:hypothetical protein
MDGILATAVGLLVGLFIPGDGNPGHLLFVAVCGFCGLLVWFRRGKSVLATLGICVLVIVLSWPIALGLRNSSDVPEMVAGQSALRWLFLSVLATMFLTGILHWLRTRHWMIPALAAAPLGILICYVSLRSPEAARMDRIEWCGIMVTGSAADGYGIGLIHDRTDRVVQAAFEDLIDLPNVKHVLIVSRNITDTGVCLLAKLSPVETMYLDSISLSHSGLESLSRMPRLRSLRLVRVRCGDEDFAGLGPSESLQELDISDCSLEDAALEHIARIKPLRAAVFQGTNLSSQAIDALRMKRPDLQVVYMENRR